VVGANIPEQGWQRIKKYWRNHGEKKGVPSSEKRPE
jgi:hypothetical protein